MIKTIVFTGDSHTYGQGAKGLLDSFNPPVVAGDLRLVSFKFNSYVNLLRRHINSYTNSNAIEYSSLELHSLYNLVLKNGCVVIGSDGIKLNCCANLFRIQLMACGEESVAELIVDGNKKVVNMQKENCYNAYVNISLFSEKETTALSIRAIKGLVYVYRIEAYSGEYAVINSGVGSCTSERFLNEYLEDYVYVFKPTIVVIEPHSINDWLSQKTPSYYEAILKEMICRHREQGCKVLMHTVSPILGEQALPYNSIPYSEYIDVSRKVAKELNVPLCDAHIYMNEYLSNNEYNSLFEDCWHVNDKGHLMYFDSIIKQLYAFIK